MGLRLVLCVWAIAVLSMPASADDLSPWFGADGQKPFRVEQAASIPDNITVDNTNSVDKLPCESDSCPIRKKAANTTSGDGGLSQN